MHRDQFDKSRRTAIAPLKNQYALAAKEPSNIRYGYVRPA